MKRETGVQEFLRLVGDTTVSREQQLNPQQLRKVGAGVVGFLIFTTTFAVGVLTRPSTQLPDSYIQNLQNGRAACAAQFPADIRHDPEVDQLCGIPVATVSPILNTGNIGAAGIAAGRN